MKKLALLCLLLCLVGCTPSYNTPAEVAEATVLEVDGFKDTSRLVGPDVKLKDTESIKGRVRCLLRTNFSAADPDRAAVVTHQAYLMFYTRGWRFFDQARDSSGTELQTFAVARNVVYGSWVEEHVGVTLSDLSGPKTLRVYGQGGVYETVTIPKIMFDGHRLALERPGPASR